MEAQSTRAWDTILKAGKRDDAKCYYEAIGKLQVEPGTTLANADRSIDTKRQDMITDKSNSKSKNVGSYPSTH